MLEPVEWGHSAEKALKEQVIIACLLWSVLRAGRLRQWQCECVRGPGIQKFLIVKILRKKAMFRVRKTFKAFFFELGPRVHGMTSVTM